MLLPFDLEQAEADPLEICPTPCGAGHISRGQPRPHHKGTGPQHSPIFGVLLYFCLHLLTQYDHIWQGSMWGRDMFLYFLGSAMPPIRRRQNPTAPQFVGSPLFMFTPFDVERPKSVCNTYEDGRVLVGHPCHCASHSLSAIAEFLV